MAQTLGNMIKYNYNNQLKQTVTSLWLNYTEIPINTSAQRTSAEIYITQEN